jgi:hypothetical protein
VSGGHELNDLLNWSETELQLAAGCAMQLEVWKIKQLAKALGGKKNGGKR